MLFLHDVGGGVDDVLCREGHSDRTNSSRVTGCLRHHLRILVAAWKVYVSTKEEGGRYAHRHVTLTFPDIERLIWIVGVAFGGKDTHTLLLPDAGDHEPTEAQILKAHALFSGSRMSVRIEPPLHPQLSSIACEVDSPEDGGLLAGPFEDEGPRKPDGGGGVFGVAFLAVRVNPVKYARIFEALSTGSEATEEFAKKVAFEAATELATARVNSAP